MLVLGGRGEPSLGGGLDCLMMISASERGLGGLRKSSNQMLRKQVPPVLNSIDGIRTHVVY